MPKPEQCALPVSAGVGAGDKRDIFRYRDKNVQFFGYTSGTFHLEVSMNGADWLQSGADVTANGFRPIPDTWNWARVRTSVGGAVSAIFAGQDFQAG